MNQSINHISLKCPTKNGNSVILSTLHGHWPISEIVFESSVVIALTGSIILYFSARNRNALIIRTPRKDTLKLILERR
jgi:hypothetical protein